MRRRPKSSNPLAYRGQILEPSCLFGRRRAKSSNPPACRGQILEPSCLFGRRRAKSTYPLAKLDLARPNPRTLLPIWPGRAKFLEPSCLTGQNPRTLLLKPPSTICKTPFFCGCAGLWRPNPRTLLRFCRFRRRTKMRTPTFETKNHEPFYVFGGRTKSANPLA